MFRITAPEPSVALDDDPATLRKFLRACVILAIFGFLVGSLGQSIWPDAILKMVVGISMFMVIALYLGKLVYFRRLALRIPDRRLARSTTIVLWGFAVTTLPYLVVCGALEAGLSPDSIPMFLFVAAPLILAVPVFWIWYMILLGRYHRAFQTASDYARAAHAHGSESGLAPKND